jgi:N-alpha-acetyltransferase 30
MDGEQCVGVIICKLDKHREALRGYIAMLAVAKEYRKRKIGTTLVQMSILAMKEQNADEVCSLERCALVITHTSNQGPDAKYQTMKLSLSY